MTRFAPFSVVRIFAYGAGLFLGSNLVGHGFVCPPQPINGLLIATAGILICGLGLKRAKGSDWERRGMCALGSVLTVAAFTLLPTLGFEVLRSCRDPYSFQWGITPPSGFVFGATYGLVALCGRLLVDVSLRVYGSRGN